MPLTASTRSLRGAFITFDGIDGCGKTTQAQVLAERLRGLGHAVVETREPGGTAIGRELRAVLLDDRHGAMTPTCELLLYLADRLQHLAELIRPALVRGDIVICDRYHDATVAYQHHGRQLDLTPLRGLIAREIDPTAPQRTFWLDLTVEAAQERIAARAAAAPAGGGDRLDSDTQAFHRRVCEGYGILAREHPCRIRRIDAGGTVETIAAEVWRHMRERFDGL